MPWYFYLLEFLSGAFLANGIPHFVQGISGSPFQSPFASPPGVGESSALSNVLWGFGNLVAGGILLHSFRPRGDAAMAGWIAAGRGCFAHGDSALHALRQGAGGQGWAQADLEAAIDEDSYAIPLPVEAKAGLCRFKQMSGDGYGMRGYPYREGAEYVFRLPLPHDSGGEVQAS